MKEMGVVVLVLLLFGISCYIGSSVFVAVAVVAVARAATVLLASRVI